VMSNNNYNYSSQEAYLTGPADWKTVYQSHLKHLLSHGEEHGIDAYPRNEQLIDPVTGYPYDPVQMDGRYMSAHDTTTPQSAHKSKGGGGGGGGGGVQPSTRGFSVLPSSLSSTAIIGNMSAIALDRLIQDYKQTNQPFCLSVNFNSPHPPMLASTVPYKDMYYNARDQIFIPPSFNDTCENSAYQRNAQCARTGVSQLQEWAAVYYSLIAEVDLHVGRLVARLNATNMLQKTLVIFTVRSATFMFGCTVRTTSPKLTILFESLLFKV
jgi:arylsulfatase A-like enzyme